MKFETHLNIGDRAYIVYNCATPKIGRLTVGEVSLRYNKKEGLEERYMCKETGIGTGNVYTYGKNIFTTEEEANKRIEELLEEYADAIAERKRYEEEERQRMIAQEKEQLRKLLRKYPDVVYPDVAEGH